MALCLPAVPLPSRTPSDKANCLAKPTAEVISFTAVVFNVVPATDAAGSVYNFKKLLANKVSPGRSVASTETEEVEADVEDSVATRGTDEWRGAYGATDTFLDDDQIEAVIPRGWTTQHGGFYIGTGPLYIRPLMPGEGDSHVYPGQAMSAEDCLAAWNARNVRRTNQPSELEALSESDSCESGSLVLVEPKKSVKPKKKATESRGSPEFPPPETAPPTADLRLSLIDKESANAAEPGRSKTKKVKRKKQSIVLGEADLSAMSDVDTDRELHSVLKQKKSFGTAVADAMSDMEDGGSDFGVPDQISDSLRDLMEEFRTMAAEGTVVGPAISDLVLRLEYECRPLKRGDKSAVFGVVAGFLSCSRDALGKRARRLRLNDSDASFALVIGKLTKAIAEDDSEGVNPDKKTLKGPIKLILAEGIQLKMTVYDLHKRRLATPQDYVKEIVETDFLPLWAKGTIRKGTLYKAALRGLPSTAKPAIRKVKSVVIGSADENLFGMPPEVPVAKPGKGDRRSPPHKKARQASLSGRASLGILANSQSNSGGSPEIPKPKVKRRKTEDGLVVAGTVGTVQ
ncbi:hypothetical protein BV898_05888 [Hypsibius exemplaris]|uniref:Ubinuclein middle domain-containing protein n=1 Tax=Hypsibius exemplaris TaxID=2072580 RepID=A0A1W0WY14_HYPEX|nr:hypothetical protein BV898_05888 [Hypsibius exemplaris]